MIGDLLDGRYRIQRLLGRGGMGAVYEARHETTGRRVAVKLIEGAPSAETGDDSVSRFQREARAAGAIESRHIAQVLDAGSDPATGAPFMVMEYLDGEDLERALRRVRALPADVALRVVAQACRGLQRAHEAGVVHRDIKPANLFLSRGEDGEITVKLLDFGIAKIQSDLLKGSGDLTATGNVLGSPRYLAPEQARASRGVDHRADLWSLGVVLYRAVSGRPLHEHVASVVELMMTICSDPPRPVQEIAPWVTPEVAAILDRALRIPPAERYESAAAMLEAVTALLPDGAALRPDMLVSLDAAARAVVAPRLLPSASVTARSGPIAVPPSTPDPTSHPVPAPRAAAARKPRAAVLAGAAALLALAAIVAFTATRPAPSAAAREPAAPAPVASAPVAAAPTPEPPAPKPPPSAAASAAAPAPAPTATASARAASTAQAKPAGRKAPSNGFDPASPF